MKRLSSKIPVGDHFFQQSSTGIARERDRTPTYYQLLSFESVASPIEVKIVIAVGVEKSTPTTSFRTFDAFSLDSFECR